MKNLVIVESPSKSKTIEKYLGSDYKVVASMGHIRELANKGKNGYGVEIENNFNPIFSVIKGKSKVINNLKKDAKEAKHIYLASDPDREGEAISYHLKDVLKLKDEDYDRVVFNEITEKAIKESFNNPRKIDYDLVNSQLTRQILDKIMGYSISKFVKYKVPGAMSAGRVQSPTLKILVDREREILNFVPEEYYTIETDFNDFKAELKKYKDKDIKVTSSVEADNIINSLSNAYNIVGASTKEKNVQGVLPFTTSSMQQMASSKLNFTSKKTMSVAQKLYEGIDLGSERVGLISYMRTDSIRLSDDFVNETLKYIANNYGKEYLGHAKSTKKKDNVQDAHEAIRPTNINRTPESVKKYLKPDEFKLYSLIYIRTLASLMSDAKANTMSVDLENNDYIFHATGQIYTFDGYLKVYNVYSKSTDTYLPDFSNYKSKVIVSDKVSKTQHFTEPPARFTEGKLIAEMEKVGIGRPSTYASTVQTEKDRKYVDVVDKKLIPNKLGFDVTDKLQEAFSNYINNEYTAKMEDDLDIIADGKLVWHEYLREFYGKFDDQVSKAMKETDKIPNEETGEMCPECGNPLVIRIGKYGKFTACSNYPECKYIKKEEPKIIEVCNCPKCDGKIIEKKTRKGKIFYGCSNYPKCDYALWDKPTGEICSSCGGLLVSKKDEIYCPVCK